jgi:exonuclease VII small subunit
MFAVDSTSSGWLAVVSLVVALILGAWKAVDSWRHAARSDAATEFTVTLDGMRTLMAQYQARTSDLEEDVEKMRADLRAARRASREAIEHAYRCDRELDAARQRIAVLEGNDGRPTAP